MEPALRATYVTSVALRSGARKRICTTISTLMAALFCFVTVWVGKHTGGSFINNVLYLLFNEIYIYELDPPV